MVDDHSSGSTTRKRDESLVFIFLVIFLFPLLTVAVVGGFGFAVWMVHALAGPPGPPV